MNTEINEGYVNHLKNNFFGILCEFEENKEWELHLDSILNELLGYPEDKKTIDYYILYMRAVRFRLKSFCHKRKHAFEYLTFIVTDRAEDGRYIFF